MDGNDDGKWLAEGGDRVDEANDMPSHAAKKSRCDPAEDTRG